MAVNVHESATDPGGAGAHDRDGQPHLVHFYDGDDALCDVVAEFIGEGLEAGEPLVVITAEDRRERLEQRLVARGYEVESACASGELIWLDAHETLAAFMDGSIPNEERFATVIGAVLARCGREHARVRAYGDMVDVLWRGGNTSAALRLEEMWTALARDQPYTLLCAYAMASFVEHPGQLEQVCALHDHRHVPQHPARIDSEMAERRENERMLRDALRELRQTEQGLSSSKRQLQTIIDALPALVAYVDADRRYRFCNLAYEQWFGRSQSSIEGKHVREVLGEDAYEGLRGRIDQALGGQSITFESRVPYRDRGERFVEATYVPDVGSDGRVQGYVALVSDVTAKKELAAAREAVGRRNERLQAITAAIASAVTPSQVFEAIVDEVASALGASSAGLWVVRDEGRTAVLVRSVGMPEQATQALAEIALGGSMSIPAIDVIRSGQCIWIDSQQELLAQYPHLAELVTPGRSYRIAALPFVVQGSTLGSIGLTFDDAPAIDDDQRGLLMMVARYSGQALERLRLLEAEATSHANAQAFAKRMALLSAASRAFSEAGHDLSTLLQTIVEQLTESYLDACTIMLISERGDTLELAAVRHRNPDADAALRAFLPIALGEGIAGRVAATGEPVLLPVIDREAFVASMAQPEHRRWAQRFMPGSLVVVPLRTHGTIVGTLIGLRDAGSAPLTRDDQALMQELAERAATAIESSRLYRDNERARVRAELLYGLAGAVNGAEHITDVFDAALEAITRALGTGRAAILLCDSSGRMRFEAWRGLSEAYRQAVEGHSPWRADAGCPQAVLVRDTQTDDALAAYRPLFEREHIRALGFFPLTSGDRLLGKFMVFHDEPRTFDPHEVDMARAIADHVASAVGRFSAMGELEQAVRFNEMFTGVLGHDLRNPLSAIMMAAQVALIRAENETLVKPLSRIMSSGERMARMIEQLLDFTRLRVGTGIPVEREPFDLVTLVRQAMEELDDTHPQWTLRLEHVGETMGAWDADRLSQVFSNLVANALQHGSVEHGVSVHVDGRAEDRVLVEISNVGVVPAPLLAKLFEPMTGGQRRRDGSRGLGLGLYITREIVRAHGGDIEVRSSESTGTTMSVTLPRR
jgi:PAS domain S-box-containing protein